MNPVAKYEVKLERCVRIPMPDGVELAAVIVRPNGEGKFPAIMLYAPYHYLNTIKPTYTDHEFDNTVEGPAYFAEHGYAVVYYDVRGTGNSGGSSQDIYSDQERADAYCMVEWIAAQPWCTGEVGMWGYSYHGVAQWQVAVQNPPHLKMLVVGSANDNVYRDWVYPWGALRPYMFDTYAPRMDARNFAPPDLDIVGEKWTDVWNERLAHNQPWGVGWISHPLDDEYWKVRSLAPDYSRIKVPVFLWSGWVDWYPTPILRAFTRINVPKKVFLGPGAHYWPDVMIPGPRVDFRRELLRWCDYWLKGIENGVMKEPPVMLFVREWSEPNELMNIDEPGFYRPENEWPLARTDYRPLYLAADGVLSAEAEAPGGRDTYRYQPSVGITAGIDAGGGIVPWGMPLDQRPDELYSLTYTTRPLLADVEITGGPRATLYVSSTAHTAFFHVILADVAPDGTSKWISDGGLVASHRDSDEKPEPIVPGEVYELSIDLKCLSYIFRAGHRIRVAIASSDFQNTWPTPEPAVNTLHRGGPHASHVILPYVPEQSPKLSSTAFRVTPSLAAKSGEMAAVFGEMEHRITHNLMEGTVTQHLAKHLLSPSTSVDGLTKTNISTRSSFTVSDLHPADASLVSSCHYTVSRLRSPEIDVYAEETLASDASSFRYLSTITITIGGQQHFQRSWRVSVPRELA